MADLEHTLRHITGALTRLGAEYALVGGLAVAVRAEPRLTRDADLAVAVDSDAAAEGLVRALRSDGYEPTASVENTRTDRLATIRLVVPGDEASAVTDLLFASCGIEPEIVAGAERLEVLPRFVVPVASVGHLIVMKVLARDDRRRPTDADDLRALAGVATEADWLVARFAARLVTDRACNRDRDLAVAIEALRANPSGYQPLAP